MRTLSSRDLVARLFPLASLLALLTTACGPRNQDPNAQPNAPTTATAYPAYPAASPPPGYPPPQTQSPPPGYPAPPATYSQYPTAPPPQQPMPPPAPVPAPVTSAQMAVPGPIAFQCQNDVPCGTHHCNMQYGKCAFPCQSAIDCISPNQCLAGLCVPTPPQPH
jgi:hypothetical protein